MCARDTSVGGCLQVLLIRHCGSSRKRDCGSRAAGMSKRNSHGKPDGARLVQQPAVSECGPAVNEKMEARGGVEPPWKDLQSSA